jgi:DNA-binding response OmpR family regulator
VASLCIAYDATGANAGLRLPGERALRPPVSSQEIHRELTPVAYAGARCSGSERTPAQSMTASRVLVFDDEASIVDLVATTLRYEGYEVATAATGRAALGTAAWFNPHLVLLDVMLPDIDGFAVHEGLDAVPVIYLTARDSTGDAVRGLTLGADDYVTKPFSPRELLARVRRAMRRNGAKARPVSNLAAQEINHEMLVFKDVHVDFTSMEATRAGKPVAMTAQEFKLLKFFARSPERVISREELLNEVWGYQNYPSTRTVDNHILRLRQKLEPDPANPRFFLTMHGAGYKFVPGQAPGGKTN